MHSGLENKPRISSPNALLMTSRRDFFKVMAAAPAALLVAKLPAQAPDPVPVKLPDLPIFEPAKLRPGAQNLSMAELNDAFLYKWIPSSKPRRR